MNENNPFWNEDRRRYAKILAWAIVVLAILAADMLGLRLPIPPPTVDEPVPLYDFGSALEDDTTFTTLATTGNASIGGALSVAGASTFSSLVDINGLADGLVLDADGDTTLSADTDDTINVELSGADDFVITANKFELQAGSVMDINGAADGLVLDADADTSIASDTDDQIDIEIAGADDFVITANTLTASAGSTIVLGPGTYPLGHASADLQVVYGTASITGTAQAAHGLSTVSFALCTLGEDPTAGGGDGAMCTVAISANVVTLKVWQDDFVTAASEADVVVYWLVIGAQA